MYELIKITDRCYYIDCPSKIGIVLTGAGQAVLIDSGNDKSAGKRALQILKNQGWELSAIYNTHSHADHIGGNKYLSENTGCKIYGSGIEVDFTRHTILEPALLYGGFPPADLRHKFLLADESDAIPFESDEPDEFIKIIKLPGHTFDMVGFLTADGVAFIGDCLSRVETLEKYGIGYIYDVEKYLQTLATVSRLQGYTFVPSHAEVTNDIRPLAQYNIDYVQSICQAIIKICAVPRIFEDILAELFDLYSMTMTPQQYGLVGSTVRSYLSYLVGNNLIRMEILENRIFYAKV